MRKMIKKYFIYYFIGELTNRFNQPFKYGKLIINSNRFIIIDSITRKQKEIKNVFQKSKDHIGLTSIIRIDTMNEVVYICAASKLFPVSYNPLSQMADNINTNRIYNDINNN